MAPAPADDDENNASHAYPPSSFLSLNRMAHDELDAAVGPKVSPKFGLSFFLFGLINNVLYVVILSAALDLVDKNSTPKGLILLVNILPALLVKVGWPYFVTGAVRYRRRIFSCSLISFLGIIIVSLSSSLPYRLLGIAIASFSSGLGEMTYLQLATVYGSLEDWGGESGSGVDLGGVAVGWFSSGTGAAGLVGAGLWWVLRGLGVRAGLLFCSFLPLCMALTYTLLLPSLSSFTSIFQAYASIPVYDVESGDEDDDDEEVARRVTQAAEAEAEGQGDDAHLTTRDKFELARPLVFRFMVPLFFVYLAEYVVNQGVSPTLLYEVPKSSDAPVLAFMIKNLRDYYPLWQLVYQTFVFFSRSSFSIFRLPALPPHLIPLPTLIQLCILFVTATESATSVFVSLFGEAGAIRCVFLLISLEGLCGGLAYVNVFHALSLQQPSEDEGGFGREGGNKKGKLRRGREKEFRIASVGWADTLGICVASLVASGLEPTLCKVQVGRGRTYCQQL